MNVRRFGFVPADATLADAQRTMTGERVDVFVTATGSEKEPVLGWITDDIILAAQRSS